MSDRWWNTFMLDNGSFIEHRDGISWAEAPAPRFFHRHQAQTRGVWGMRYFERCACGAFGPKWTLIDRRRHRGWRKKRHATAAK